MKRGKKKPSVEVNEHGPKREIIIRHNDEQVRVLCDGDGIHLGTIRPR